MSESPDDLPTIIADHLLIAAALTALVEHILGTVSFNIHRVDHWQKIQQLRNDFWKMWKGGPDNIFNTSWKYSSILTGLRQRDHHRDNPQGEHTCVSLCIKPFASLMN